jgi:hypothetical protein
MLSVDPASRLQSGDVHVTLVNAGVIACDHRLFRPQDIALLLTCLELS